MSGFQDTFQDFRPGLRHYLARLLAPLRPCRVLWQPTRCRTAQVTSSVSGSSSPHEGLLLAAPRLRPRLQDFRRACVAVPFLTRCVLVGVLKAVGPARADPWSAHEPEHLGNLGLESSPQGTGHIKRSQSSGSAGPTAFLGGAWGCG